MRILAIETSCDETAICLLQAEPTIANSMSTTSSDVQFTVIRNITHTQLEHQEFGGVFPVVAKREHQKHLPLILEKIMEGQTPPDVICVTNGPGLEPALWCGIVFAKELGAKWNIPVVPVNHMEGHILSVLAPALPTSDSGTGASATFTFTENDLALPMIALLISGGHTELVSSSEIGSYQLIGRTKDDAVGEAFDKVARMMNLPYPGGPEISKLADAYKKMMAENPATTLEQPTFPRPMIHSKDFDFSFSGLKTAVLYHLQNLL
jgi:N6-L-threonylcarbamoyladenine synthase